MTDNPQYSGARPGSQENRRPSWFCVDSRVVDEYFEYLSPQDIMLYIYLCRHADHNGVVQASEYCGLRSYDQWEAENRLKQTGLITVDKYRDKDSVKCYRFTVNRVNPYFVDLDHPEDYPQ